MSERPCKHKKIQKECLNTLEMIIYLRDKRLSEAEKGLMGETVRCKECGTDVEITREWLYGIVKLCDKS